MKANKDYNTVKKWIQRGLANKEYILPRTFDCHIDFFDEKLRYNKKLWLNKSIYFLEIAVDIKRKLKLPFFAIAAISLSSGWKKRGFFYKSLYDITKALSSSSPSIYLIQEHNTFWLKYKPINIIHWSINVKDFDTYYHEWYLDSENRFLRTIVFAEKMKE